ncbi:MAG: cysteine hydrolase family protein [Marinoscillum sp.]
MINPALILIDIQVGLDQYEYYGGNRNNLQAESNCQKLLGFFRENQLPYIFIQHDSTNPESPLYPGKPGHEIKHEVKPKEGDVVIHKSVNSAFIGTNLEGILRKENITNVIIVGLTTEHCISTSVRMSANLGFNTTLISDATAAFDKVTPDGVRYDAEIVHQVELANLKDEFASVLTTDEIIQLLQGPLSQL